LEALFRVTAVIAGADTSHLQRAESGARVEPRASNSAANNWAEAELRDAAACFRIVAEAANGPGLPLRVLADLEQQSRRRVR
jgi:hypothetical protein